MNQRKKLPPQMMRFILPLILTFLMTCVVSAISTLRGIGFSENFFKIWLSSWIISWIIAYPVMLIFMPVAQRITHFFVEKPPLP